MSQPSQEVQDLALTLRAATLGKAKSPRKEAVEFSFFLAAPTMAAAAGLDLLKNYDLILSGGNFGLLAVGFLVSFVTAAAAIKLLLRYISTNDFVLFGVYRIIIALVFLAVFF